MDFYRTLRSAYETSVYPNVSYGIVSPVYFGGLDFFGLALFVVRDGGQKNTLIHGRIEQQAISPLTTILYPRTTNPTIQNRL